MQGARVLLVVVATFLALSNACGDAFHAHCQLQWYPLRNISEQERLFNGTQCSTMVAVFTKQFQSCCAEKAIQEPYTHYTLVSSDPNKLYVSGTITFSDGYVDQQFIQFTQK
jgi:hypothetical protein